MNPDLSGQENRRWRVGPLTYTTGGLVVLFCWLLAGDFAFFMKERSATGVLQLLLKKFEASDFLTGTLIPSLPAAMTIVLSPIVSYRSDRHRGPWGRRIPFLALTVPVAVLAMIGLAFSPSIGAFLHQLLGAQTIGQNTLILILFGLFWAVFESASVTIYSLFGALVNDVVPSALLGRFYGVFRAASLIAGILYGRLILGKAEEYYRWIFLGLAALYAVGFLLMCLKVKEPPAESLPPKKPAQPGENHFLAAAAIYFRECFSHSYYRWFYVAVALSWIVQIPLNTFSLYLAQSLSMDMQSFGDALALTYLISLGLSYPLGMLADRFHPLRTSMAALLLYAAVTLWGWLYARDIAMFRVAFVAQGVIFGAWLTLTASLGQRLLPHAKFAQFYSAALMLQNAAVFLIGPLVGRGLDYTGHVYRHVFLIASGLAALALLASWILHAKFMALGGPKNYTPPGEA